MCPLYGIFSFSYFYSIFFFCLYLFILVFLCPYVFLFCIYIIFVLFYTATLLNATILLLSFTNFISFLLLVIILCYFRISMVFQSCSGGVTQIKITSYSRKFNQILLLLHSKYSQILI